MYWNITHRTAFHFPSHSIATTVPHGNCIEPIRFGLENSPLSSSRRLTTNEYHVAGMVASCCASTPAHTLPITNRNRRKLKSLKHHPEKELRNAGAVLRQCWNRACANAGAVALHRGAACCVAHLCVDLLCAAQGAALFFRHNGAFRSTLSQSVAFRRILSRCSEPKFEDAAGIQENLRSLGQ